MHVHQSQKNSIASGPYLISSCVGSGINRRRRGVGFGSYCFLSGPNNYRFVGSNLAKRFRIFVGCPLFSHMFLGIRHRRKGAGLEFKRASLLRRKENSNVDSELILLWLLNRGMPHLRRDASLWGKHVLLIGFVSLGAISLGLLGFCQHWGLALINSSVSRTVPTW